MTIDRTSYGMLVVRAPEADYVIEPVRFLLGLSRVQRKSSEEPPWLQPWGGIGVPASVLHEGRLRSSRCRISEFRDLRSC